MNIKIDDICKVLRHCYIVRFTKTYIGVPQENRKIQTFKKGMEEEREGKRKEEGRKGGTTSSH